MTPVFSINFRREAYQRELARTRRRLLTLGGWLTYFGLLGVIVGLYGLNCAVVTNRAGQLERQAVRARAISDGRQGWQLGAPERMMVEQFKANPARWRTRLVRLSELLPTNAVLSSMAINPENLSSVTEQNKLVLVGSMRVPPGQDRMRPVVQLVSALQSDSVFARGYTSVRLSSSQAASTPGNFTEFVIECR